MIIKGWYYLCVAALTLTLAGCGNKNSNIDYYDPETLGFTVTREASINDFVGNGSEQHATATYEVSKKDFSMNGVGGLQDAYTYNVRGNVFANAQTGNVVLMSQSFLMGNAKTGLKYLIPIVAFALGIILSEQIEHRLKDAEKIHWRQVILLAEILLLGVVGILPQESNMIANIMVSLSCAMQVQSFRKVNGYGYASTMCIGNLRSGTESLSRYMRNREQKDLHKTMHYYGIIFFFAIGAGLGGLLSLLWGIYTIWFSVVLLLIDVLIMIKE